MERITDVSRELLTAAERLVAPDFAEGDYAKNWTTQLTYHAEYLLPIIERLRELEPGERVLDLGCGFGCLCAAAMMMGLEPTGVELSVPFPQVPNVRWLRGDVQDPDLLCGEAFAAVLLTETLEHLQFDARPLLARVGREWLEPGGLFLGSTPDPAGWPWPALFPGDCGLPPWRPGVPPPPDPVNPHWPGAMHVRLYAQDEFYRLAADAGLVVDRLEYRAPDRRRYYWEAHRPSLPTPLQRGHVATDPC